MNTTQPHKPGTVLKLRVARRGPVGRESTKTVTVKECHPAQARPRAAGFYIVRVKGVRKPERAAGRLSGDELRTGFRRPCLYDVLETTVVSRPAHDENDGTCRCGDDGIEGDCLSCQSKDYELQLSQQPQIAAVGNVEYSDPENGKLVLCPTCRDELLEADDDEDGVELIISGLKLPTDDPCEHCAAA